jgi:hypothetical protein
MTEYNHDAEVILEMEECSDCGCEQEEGRMEYTNPDGDYICDGCSNDYIHCDNCDEQLPESDTRYSELHSEYYCENCYYDIITHCADCDCELESDYAEYSESRGDYFCDSCYPDEQPDWEVYSNKYITDNDDFVNPNDDNYKKDTFNIIKSRRYVGIEIETNYEDEQFNGDIRDYLHRVINESRELEADPSTTYRRQDVVYDGSVTDGEHRYGNEIVMQPRRGDLIVHDVNTITTALKRIEAYPSVRCGLHLHIDARDYDWLHFTVLTLMTKLIEPHVYTWVPPSRLSGNWSRKVSQSVKDFAFVASRDEFIEAYYDNGGFSRDKYNDKRYHGLNLHCHFQANQGIEIRYHGGTLNTEKIQHWTIFWTNVVDTCYEIAEKIRDEQLSSYDNFKNTDIYKSLAPIKLDKIRSLEMRYNRYHMKDGEFTDIVQYKKDSEMLRRYLKLPKHNKPYLVEPMLRYLRYREDNTFMSIENIFDTFRIPDETREFFKDRTKTIRRRDESHVYNCFGGKQSVVEFDSSTMKFKYVDNMSNQFPLVSDKRLSEYCPTFEFGTTSDLFNFSNNLTQSDYSRFI